MRAVHLEIENNNYDTFMTIIKNLKAGVIINLL